MSKSKEVPALMQLRRIEDALLESVLRASGEEIREELVASGIDPESCIAQVEGAISSAVAECAEARLKSARVDLEAWRARRVGFASEDFQSVQTKLDLMRSGNQDLDRKMTLAARKGEGLSEGDLQGLLEDLAELAELAGHDENENE